MTSEDLEEILEDLEVLMTRKVHWIYSSIRILIEKYQSKIKEGG